MVRADAMTPLVDVTQADRDAAAALIIAKPQVENPDGLVEDKYRLMLLNLLAVIHRDGGHKTEEIGVKLAWEQAMQLSSERIAALRTAPAPDGLRYQRAEGETLAEMRENARKGDLYPRGDMALVWVNEADLPLRGESRNV